jgi:PKD repeat protein
MAIYDITLSVISVDGCRDTITKAELLDIKRPYPYFFIDNSIICDGEEINIVDSSYYTSNVGMYTQNVFYDSTFYQINDTTSITYTFPYELTEELQYNYSVKLNGFLGQCTAQYTDSMTVLPNAQIDVILSDSIGCPPFTVEFTENSTYLIPDSSIYFWDFGDGTIDSVQHPTHTYTEPGAYNVYHSVLTENGCFSDSILSTQIEIFEYPVADFNFFVTTFCSGLGDLQLNNTSIYITDTIACYWSFELDSLVESIEFNPLIHFEETNVYYASLQITDLHGCVDDTTKLIEITVLDTIVSQPILNYVSVNSTDVYIEWASVQDENFESLSLFHSLDGVNWNTIYSTNDLSLNNFTHDVDTRQSISM